MPFNNITNKHFDGGDYPEAMSRALAAIDVESIRARQKSGEPGRAPHRRRHVDLLRTGGAWHVRVFRLGHSDGAGP